MKFPKIVLGIIFLFGMSMVASSFKYSKDSLSNITISSGLDIDLDYCSVNSQPWNEYFTNVKLKEIDNTSEKDPNSGPYGTTEMAIGETSTLEMSYLISKWGTVTHYLTGWIDFNGDGNFDNDPTEIVFSEVNNHDNNGPLSYSLSKSITIPSNASIGEVRLRISVKRDSAADPCENGISGEFEDYIINIIPGNNNGDTTPPEPTLNTSSATVSGPFQVNLSFNENINGLTGTDFQITNGAISNLSASSGASFNFTVTPNNEGNTSISLPGNRVTDDAGNNNTASNQLNITYTNNSTPPPPTGSGLWSSTEQNIYYDSGIVGINMNNTQYDAEYRLMVNGDIKARRMKVTPEGWADFVFEDSYNLMPLKDVEKFIKENKHLPNVPSEKEVLTDGIYVGETNKILLQKIEELTLYIIDLEKRIKKNEEDLSNSSNK